MEIVVDYTSPYIFISTITVFLCFFLFSRNYRFHLNALLGVLGLLASIWFFLFYLLEGSAGIDTSGITTYIVVLSAAICYFLLLLISREESPESRFGKIMPANFLFFSGLVKLVMGAEIVLIGMGLLTFALMDLTVFDFPDATVLAVQQAVFLVSFVFLVENTFCALVSALFLLKITGFGENRSVEKLLAQVFALLWLLFSFGCLVLPGVVYASNFQQVNWALATWLTLSLLGVILLQTIFVSWRYFLSYKVIIAQFVAALIIMFNLASILISSTAQEIALRATLIVFLIFLSLFLVKSVVSEVQKKKDIQETARKIYDANNKLQKLDRAKSDFIAGASHQLRSPLSVIKGIVSMLLDGSYGKTEGSIKDALEKVYISNERLIGLIESLLDISHLEAGRVEFSFVKTDLNEIAQKAVDGLALQARNKKLYLKFSPCKNAKFLVWADESKVTEAISNLIDNALKYTRKGGVSVQVQKVGSLVRVSVSDTGIGLKKEEIKNLFQKFVRAGRGNKLSPVGTGLGLYVVRKMIEAHKGRIWAESAGESRGSNFIIELPLNLKNPPDQKFIQRMVAEKQPA